MAFDYESWKIANDQAKKDPRVVAIRADARVGVGTCTYVDETLDAVDIIRELNEVGIYLGSKDRDQRALAWAYEYEGLSREIATNASSGEPDCPLVGAYREWNDEAK